MEYRVAFIEPEVVYPVLIPNTGMNLGLLKIAGALKRNYPNIHSFFWSEQIEKAGKEIANLEAETFETFLKRTSPDCCFISALTCQVDRARELCEIAKSMGVSTVALGGHFVSGVGELICKRLSGFDIFISGPGEETIVSIIENLLSHKPIPSYLSVDYRKKLSEDIFSVEPDFSIFPHDKAVSLGLAATMELSRGCNNHCKFCTLIEHSRGIAYESPARVKNYAKFFIQQGYKKAIICDDTFVISSRTLKQLKGMDFSKHLLQKTVLTRVDCINPETAKQFARHQVREVILGVEHIDAEILKNMNKTLVPEDWAKIAQKAIACLSDYGIVSHPIFMLGWPGETTDTLLRLTEFAVSIGSDDLVQPFVSFCTPHPGSYLWKNRKKIGICLLPASLKSYTHLSPVAYPESLGNDDNALRRLVDAHNTIRVETGVSDRNPVIDIANPYILGSYEDLHMWDE